jgi:arylsulfatase
MDPYEKYDMIFNGAAPTRVLSTSAGKYSGQDNGWVLSLIYPALIDFDQSVMKYPSIKRFPGGASNDLVPDLQHPDNPVPLLNHKSLPKAIPTGG